MGYNIHMDKVLEIMNVLNNIEYGFKDKDGNNLINSEICDEFYNYIKTQEKINI